MARDIVCDMTVNEDEARQKGLFSDHNGVTMYFCSCDCKSQFDADPDKFMSNKPSGLYAGTRSDETAQSDGRSATTM